MRLAAAAEAAGVSKQTIEYYIMIDLIKPIRHKDRFGRFFDDKIIRRIKAHPRTQRNRIHPPRYPRNLYQKQITFRRLLHHCLFYH